jgi:outer membrane lipoprotein-sorting protein
LLRFVLLCAALSLLTACPNQHNLRSSPTNDAARETMLQQILAQRIPLLSLEGSAKLRITESGKKRRIFRLFYMMKRPNQLYLELTAALQQPGAIITSDGKRFALHNLLQKEFLQGPAERLPHLLESYLPAMLPLDQLISALLGDPPILPAKQRKWSKEKALWVLSLQGESHKQTLWIDEQARQIVRVVFDWNKKPALTLEYGGFRGSPALPRTVAFGLRSRGLKADWVFLEQKRNTTLPDKNFQQKIPTGVPTRELAAIKP